MTSSENEQNVKSYLSGITHGPEIDDFIRSLIKKIGAVLLNRYYVKHDIVDSNRLHINLAKLPSGLVRYYDGYRGRWREYVEKWDALSMHCSLIIG